MYTRENKYIQYIYIATHKICGEMGSIHILYTCKSDIIIIIIIHIYSGETQKISQTYSHQIISNNIK